MQKEKDPYAYLRLLLTELPYLGKSPSQEYLDNFLPWKAMLQNVALSSIPHLLLRASDEVLFYGRVIIERLRSIRTSGDFSLFDYVALYTASWTGPAIPSFPEHGSSSHGADGIPAPTQQVSGVFCAERPSRSRLYQIHDTERRHHYQL